MLKLAIIGLLLLTACVAHPLSRWADTDAGVATWYQKYTLVLQYYSDGRFRCWHPDIKSDVGYTNVGIRISDENAGLTIDISSPYVIYKTDSVGALLRISERLGVNLDSCVGADR